MSKGLEELEKIKKEHYVDGRLPLIDRVRFDIIEKELEENERLKTSYLENLLNEESKEYIYKKLNAFEIIKEIWGDSILCDIEKGFIIGYPYTKLPDKEKQDLLKEVLSCH